MGHLPRPGMEPVSPELEGRLLSTVLPGKSMKSDQFYLKPVFNSKLHEGTDLSSSALHL